MASENFEDLLGRYIQAFGEPPLDLSGVTDELLATLMREALEQGRPIPEEDYYRELPDGADA